MNIAGNETGQQASFVAKGARQGDAVWTMDGVPITDMATAGASPTYFDYDAFDEIQISTGGNDIKQATGGVGLNFVVKRGTNQFRGTARGYYTGEDLEATNLPDELVARGVTPRRRITTSRSPNSVATSAVPSCATSCSSGARLPAGHPSLSPVGARHRPHRAEDLQRQGQLAGDGEGHGQLPVLQRRQDQEGRAPGNALFEPASARYNQGNYYTDNPLHGLWKWEDNRVLSNNWFLTGKYAYYNTGFTLESIGPLTEQMGISALHGQTFGSTNASYFTRPQHTVNVDSNYFKSFGDYARLQVRRRLAADRYLLAHNLPRQRHRGLRELGHQLPRPHLSRGRRHQPRLVPQLLRRRHDRDGPADAGPRSPLRPSVGQGGAEPDGGEQRVPEWCPASSSLGTRRRSTGTTSRPASA